MIRELARLTAPLKRRVLLMIGRAVLAAVDDSTRLQSVQVKALAGETIDRAERFQQYGFTSHPHPGAECVLLAAGGNRNHPLVVAIDDRLYRRKNMAAGEVALYASFGQFIELRADGAVELRSANGQSSVVIADGGITLTAPRIDMEEP